MEISGGRKNIRRQHHKYNKPITAGFTPLINEI